MAQDLLLDPIHKQAVELKPNGFYAVNYTHDTWIADDHTL
jgi:hypothetical protein